MTANLVALGYHYFSFPCALLIHHIKHIAHTTSYIYSSLLEIHAYSRSFKFLPNNFGFLAPYVACGEILLCV